MAQLKVTCISDIHGQLPHIDPCDILLIAGDICPNYYGPTNPFQDSCVQASWLASKFAPWLEKVEAKHVVGIAGNHDFIWEKHKGLVPSDLRWTYLQDASTEIEGLKIYGSPWSNWFYDWAFNSPNDGNRGEEWLANVWDAIPLDTDILVTHAPPFALQDWTWRGNYKKHLGSKTLFDRMRILYREHNLKLHVYGHIHDAYGLTTFDREDTSNFYSINAAYCAIKNGTYVPLNKPITVDIFT